MLENGNFIGGFKGKQVSRLLAEYEDITAKINDLEETKKQVLAKIFELSEIGINETMKYVFKVIDNKGRVSISAKKLQEQNSQLFETVKDMGLVTQGENYLTVRGIKLKGDRV